MREWPDTGDGAGTPQRPPHRTFTAIRRCVSGACIVARLGLEELCEQLLPSVRSTSPGRRWSRAGDCPLLRAVERIHIAEDWYRRTALRDLLQLSDEEVNKDRLYRGLDHLLGHKSRRWRRICRSVAASYSRCRTKCCSTTSPAPISKARRKPTRRRSAAIRVIIA